MSVDSRMEACKVRDGPTLSLAGTLYIIQKSPAIKDVVNYAPRCNILQDKLNY